MSDFLSVADLSADELAAVLARAAAVKQDPGSVAGRHAGLKVGLFFEKPSARTRISTEVATADLGAVPIVLRQDEIGLGRREATEDVARVLDRYLDLIAFRVFSHAALVTVAEYAEVPVVNLLSDLEHPCQALADLQTVAEVRPLPGTVLTYVGDGNNVCNSLMLAGAMSGMTIRVTAPEGYEPDDGPLKMAERLAAQHGGSVAVITDPAEAVAGADVVYTDVWTSMGQEDEAEERKALFAPYRVDEALFDQAGPDAVFLHCLPAHRGEEVTDDVVEHRRSLVFDQAENRMHSFKALLLHLWR
jgi:ornithine carbamoyltransferase